MFHQRFMLLNKVKEVALEPNLGEDGLLNCFLIASAVTLLEVASRVCAELTRKWENALRMCSADNLQTHWWWELQEYREPEATKSVSNSGTI